MLQPVLDNLPLALIAAGLVLMTLEALSPGAHLIVIGVALLGAGLIGMVFGAGSPFVLAALVLLFGAAATYVYREFDFYGGKGTAQTSDSNSLSGRTGYVTETVTNRGGEIKLDEGGFSPYYTARTTRGTIEEGEEVIVIDPGGGNVLTVESMGALGEDEIDRALERGVDEESVGGSETGTAPEEPATETEKSG